MPAYLIADIEVHDAEAYELYRGRVGGVIAKFGGRFLVRGGRTQVLEGSWDPHRIVVIEFPSIEHGQRWHGSAEYRELRELRRRASSANSVLVEAG